MMKKRKTGDKLNIALDLTSLLDVIFIVLMVVMCNRTLDTQNVEEVQAKLQDAESTIEMYESHTDDIENLSEKVAFVTLYADFDEADPSVRHIKMMIGDDLRGFEPFDLTPENEDAQYGLIESKLSAYLDEYKDIPVWITIDDGNILYRDWVKLQDMTGNLAAGHLNLYVNDKLELR